MSSVENYPYLLDRAAGATGGVRDAVGAVLATLASSLAGRGEPWGRDRIGRRFADGADGYLASKRNLEQNAAAIAETFDRFSTTQYDAARMWRATEAGNEGQFG
ncbi:MAG TPA: hypothetical protein VK083_14885 [Nocardia sp.]|uniref:hypothetical protein n=1 Tax=Nocardia TaxID=1817 RepID=UPI002455C782|nr:MULTISPECIES: hypothetical protein [Nocardia]HLS78065.1 hypothetical protein [Nocardia sp.]